MSLKKKVKFVRTEEHHRRPRSLGGLDSITNISYVEWNKHQSWHTLFGNMNAQQICNVINSCFKPPEVEIVCKFINGQEVLKKGGKESNNKKKRSCAWETLFKGLSFKEAIQYINNTWLDPSYHLYIEKI